MFGSSEIIWLNDVDSTNRFALENFDAFPHGTMIVAPSQSSGRGSRGRVWISPPDVNVYASLVLKNFDFLPSQAAWIGSLAVLEVLRNHAPRLPLSVKWPNDVLCGEKKIAGILCETTAGKRGIVIGAGININMDAQWIARLGRPATSLFLETGRLSDDVGSFAVQMRQIALELYETTQIQGIASLHERWRQENFLNGKSVFVRLDGGGVLSGVVTGFSPEGALLLSTAPETVVPIASGEVLLPSLRHQGTAHPGKST